MIFSFIDGDWVGVEGLLFFEVDEDEFVGDDEEEEFMLDDEDEVVCESLVLVDTFK